MERWYGERGPGGIQWRPACILELGEPPVLGWTCQELVDLAGQQYTEAPGGLCEDTGWWSFEWRPRVEMKEAILLHAQAPRLIGRRS